MTRAVQVSPLVESSTASQAGTRVASLSSPTDVIWKIRKEVNRLRQNEHKTSKELIEEKIRPGSFYDVVSAGDAQTETHKIPVCF